MKHFIKLFSIYAILSSFLLANDAPSMAVYDLTTKSSKTFKTRFFGGITSSSNHYSSQLRDFKVAAVIHGSAYKFLLKDPSKSQFKDDTYLIRFASDIKKMILTLRDSYGVEFYVCGAGLRSLGIDKSEIYDFIHISPNAMVPLIDRQNEGFAYIPVF